jgi:S1-C subfamily serine protease
MGNRDLDIEAQTFDLEDLASDPLPATAAEKVAKPVVAVPPDAGVPLSWRGIIVKELSAAEGAKKGGRIEIVRVKKSSPADRAGLYEGAILTELKYAGNKAIQKLQTLDDLKRLIAKTTGPVALYTAPDGYVTVEEK